ncbi:peptide-methionine (S)-S-oxide reductase MsrA [Rossellomorea aquimaris]|uniref:peptide-methionine (S)-S-oxide reductase MsrA n=1 Tax=Rossellomorea aquimaris TaxID=189382 RepID=UPI003D16A990
MENGERMRLMKENPETRKATFAGGCFWCMVQPFEEMPGIIHVVSGYTGGEKENPTYREVCSETTGHYEAVQITYDPEKFPYEKLLELYWQQIDPTDPGGQFFDRGQSYTTAIFYHNEEQRIAAEESKQDLAKSGKFQKPIVTKILPAKEFYEAEDYHQQYYKKNPSHYQRYSIGSGRKAFTKQHWGSSSEEKRRLEKTFITHSV